MTIHSFTDPQKTYETTPETCECQAKYFNPGQKCKHQKALIGEINRATFFLMLKARFDCRANGDEATHRINFEMALGY